MKALVDLFDQVAAEHPEDAVIKAKAADASYQIICLRGVYAAITQEPPGAWYEVDCLQMAVNDTNIKRSVVPDLHRLGLGPVTFAAPTTSIPTYPLQGLLWWYNDMPFFTFIVERTDNQGVSRKIQLPFFVDTGGQKACMNEAHTNMHLGMGRTKGVNMIGSRFLSNVPLMLCCEYAGKGAVLIESTHQNRCAIPDMPAQVEQWIDFSTGEIDAPLTSWVYPLFGFWPYDKKKEDAAKAAVSKALNVLEGYLATRTYLVGDAITLADVITTCNLYHGFSKVVK
ncbi:hypothetical protein WJX72_006549 [[Myrmecia] bisecta]|uniref:GST C-terminal domain-containing protein n=1 Tax=[Myrmecia] bisecta TaxID=41462 RepID=A0AAW1PL79_9CHLO